MSSFDQIEGAHKAISRYLESVEAPSKTLRSILEQNARTIANILGPYEQIAKDMAKVTAAFSGPLLQLKQIAEMTTLYQSLIPKLAYNFQFSSYIYDSFQPIQFKIPNYLQSIDFSFKGIIETSTAMGSAYTQLRDAAEERTVSPEIAKDFIINPTISTAGHLRTLQSLEICDANEGKRFDKELLDTIDYDWKETEKKINEERPEWISILQGAEQSLQSKNPEKVRHTIVSLRELLTSILHKYAPDELIRKEMPEKEWYFRNAPTRRARLTLIIRKKYPSSEFITFIDKDIDAVLELFTLLQKGTHEIVSNISDRDLRFLLARIKVLISELMSCVEKTTS